MNSLRGIVVFLPLLAALGAAPVRASEWAAELDWADLRHLGTPLSGLVAETPVAPGERVAEGALLLRLDAGKLRARLQRAEAARTQAREDLDEAKRELERVRELFDRTVASTHDLQLAEIAHTRARAAWDSADAEVQAASLDLAYAELRSPYPAIVVDVRARPGEVVVNRMQAQPLVTTARGDRMLAVARLAPSPPGLAVGQAATVILGEETRPGVLVAIRPLPAGAEAAPGVTVEVEFPAGAGREFLPGAPVRLRLP